MNNNEMVKEIKNSAISVTNTQNLLQVKLEGANNVITHHNELVYKLNELHVRYDDATKRKQEFVYEIPENYNKDNHDKAMKLVNDIGKYDDLISKVNKINNNISKDIDAISSEVEKIEEDISQLKNDDQLIRSVDIINDFVESKMFNDAIDALDTLEKLVSTTETSSNKTEVTKNEADESNDLDVDDTFNRYVDLVHLEEYKMDTAKSKMINQPSDLSDGERSFITHNDNLYAAYKDLALHKNIDSLANFYTDKYSDIVNAYLNDKVLDTDRLEIIDVPNAVEESSVSYVSEPLDAFTDDLINDVPDCNTFEFDMTGEFKVVSSPKATNLSAEKFIKHHKKSIKWLNTNKSELDKILYAVNFEVCASENITSSLEEAKMNTYNEGEYYTIHLPSSILCKYIERHCNSIKEPKGLGLHRIAEIFNVMVDSGNGNYHINYHAVNKYIFSHIISDIPSNIMLYRHDVCTDEFANNENKGNEYMFVHSILANGYDKIKTIGFIKDELENIKSFNIIESEDRKDDIAELVYQIWYNQICKLLFNNNTNKEDDSDIIPPSYNQALIMDTEPITNFDESFNKNSLPIEFLIGANMFYTSRMIDLNKQDAFNFNLLYTFANVSKSIDDEKEISMAGQRLDFDTMYKLFLAAEIKAENQEQEQKTDSET